MSLYENSITALDQKLRNEEESHNMGLAKDSQLIRESQSLIQSRAADDALKNEQTNQLKILLPLVQQAQRADIGAKYAQSLLQESQAKANNAETDFNTATIDQRKKKLAAETAALNAQAVANGAQAKLAAAQTGALQDNAFRQPYIALHQGLSQVSEFLKLDDIQNAQKVWDSVISKFDEKFATNPINQKFLNPIMQGIGKELSKDKLQQIQYLAKFTEMMQPDDSLPGKMAVQKAGTGFNAAAAGFPLNQAQKAAKGVKTKLAGNLGLSVVNGNVMSGTGVVAKPETNDNLTTVEGYIAQLNEKAGRDLTPQVLNTLEPVKINNVPVYAPKTPITISDGTEDKQLTNTELIRALTGDASDGFWKNVFAMKQKDIQELVAEIVGMPADTDPDTLAFQYNKLRLEKHLQRLTP